jgi:hypothetical protein
LAFIPRNEFTESNVLLSTSNKIRFLPATFLETTTALLTDLNSKSSAQAMSPIAQSVADELSFLLDLDAVLAF